MVKRADDGGVATSRLQAAPALLGSLSSHLERFAGAVEPQERAALMRLLRAAGDYTPRRLVAATPAEMLLGAAESAIVERLRAEPSPESCDFQASLTIIVKATRLCNLRCTYCHSWSGDPGNKMSFEVLARAIRDGLRAPNVRNVNFVWHGGEVTLLPLSFYRKAVWLQEQFRRRGQIVTNTVQTNGTRLSREWLTFLRLYEFKIGVSLDGPPELHDRRRLDIAGRPTSERVRKSLA